MTNIKKILLFGIIAVTAISCATRKAPQAAEEPPVITGQVSLEAALEEFSGYIADRVPNAALTAVAITQAPVQRLGDYIADELAGLLLNEAGLRVVSRPDFERVLAEQNIQAASYFDDDSTAKMGRSQGWKTIIFGAIEPMQEAYRLSLRAVDVETGELRGTRSYILNHRDPVLICLVNPDIPIERLTERETVLRPFDGAKNNFELFVATNKTVYYDNERMFITLRANEDCYFVVYHLDIDNNMQVIYPNMWDRDRNFLSAGIARVIPEDSTFLLHAPYGEERILVYASDTPISIPEDQYKPRSISRDFLASPEALWHIEDDEGQPTEALNADELSGLSADSGDEDLLDPPENGRELSVALVESEDGDAGIPATIAEVDFPIPIAGKSRDVRGMSVTPRGATFQVVYTILPALNPNR